MVPTVALLEDGENGPHCSLHHPRQFCIRDGFDAVVVLAVLDGRLYPTYTQFGELILLGAWFRGVAAPEDSELEGNAISTTDTVVKECSQQKTLCLSLLAPACYRATCSPGSDYGSRRRQSLARTECSMILCIVFLKNVHDSSLVRLFA